MRKITFFLIILMSITLTASANYNAPESIAGITIGKQIDSIKSMITPESSKHPWMQSYIKRYELRDLEGYRGGYVVTGACKRTDTILRMKLKYQNDSSGFFDEIYDKLESRFGSPSDWRGNPFGTLKIWKWSLKDSKGNITLILQHYTGEDDSITSGNSIRLSRPDWIKEEKKCWNEANPPVPCEKIPAKMKGMSWFLPY